MAARRSDEEIDDELFGDIAHRYRQHRPPELMRWALAKAGTTSLDVLVDSVQEDGPAPPSWPSGISRHDGSSVEWRGVVALGGDEGLGKSKLAMRSAILFLKADPTHRVVYINSELDASTLALYRYQASGLKASEWLEEYGPGPFRAADVNVPAENVDVLARISDYIAVSIDDVSTRVLVVWDTINTISQFTQPSGSGIDEWGFLRSFGMWQMMTRKLSEGRIAHIVVSELNKDKAVYGKKLAKLADVVMTMVADDDPERVVIRLSKDRYGASGVLGVYLREWSTCRFIPIG